ncbi:hypothetical protein HYDPIDRAFT_175275 [Hydnomerulius pinastri MD-312]|uniref:Hyaluronan/mRNA-binding protein domain-containing protein n=1 Tax=Hydnomerulius pinastri MD-312 TaxID=994086 RepID=A0A0C9WG27_9AGAM|nr:hypothetical protein HYDPIDRAFT_175275 [Hydnomerulius pinastri MD-312]
MTRTERSAFPRALVRDRSESKSGLDKSLRKGGGGHHNWGSLADEGYLEAAAMEDEEKDLAEAQGKKDGTPNISDIIDFSRGSFPDSVEKPEKPVMERRSNSVTEEERQSARKFRKNALKGQDIDLSAIARTSSAVSASPPGRVTITSGADSDRLSPKSV